MTEQLKPLPCPFCGGENTKTHVYEGEAPDAFVQCHDCTSTGPSGEGDAGAIEDWNRRAQPAQAVPMTDEQVDKAMRVMFYPSRNRAFMDGVRAAEKFHGIVGKEGGDVES